MITKADKRESKPLGDYASGDAMSIAGKPADVCPYCGAGMFANKTITRGTMIGRYRTCRNCKRSFYTRQPVSNEEIVREVE